MNIKTWKEETEPTKKLAVGVLDTLTMKKVMIYLKCSGGQKIALKNLLDCVLI